MKKHSFWKRYIAGIAATSLLLAAAPFFSGKVWAATGDRCSYDRDAETIQWIQEAGETLTAIADERDIMALVYLEDSYPVRALPSFDSEVTVTVLSGQQVNIRDIYVDDDNEVWEYVELEWNGAPYFGYIPRAYLAVSDARFLEWEESYGMNPGISAYAIDEEGRASYPDIRQFPPSYQPALQELKQKHPNWTFVKMNTTLDWETVVYNEMQNGKSLVYKSFPDWAKNGSYDNGNWYYATEAALKLYLDPRNSLSENSIFQFEQLTYNEKYHTLEAVQSFLNNTFMNDSKPAPGVNLTFAEMFWYIGKEEGREVSPFHLAARVLQEQGQGNSPLISGTYPGYEGYYNYFNIGASGTTNTQVIENGLKYAKEKNWNSSYFSILGGSDFISANYIKKGQDTLYLQKYNVNPNGFYKPYTHQYMQNISAPTTEAASIKKLYQSAESLDSTFVFKIPVYENMPAQPCGAPGTEQPEQPVEESYDIMLELPEGYGDTTVWLDGVSYEGTLEENQLIVTAEDRWADMAVVYKYNESGVPVGMYVWSLSYGNGCYTATPESDLENLLTYHGFSIRITGKSGIRFKTGISTETRNRLTGEGVSGYRLKEYGTLVMNHANRERYPMIKGGAKVQSGMAYGADGNGGFRDVVYETVDGRYRYTSVLVGLPVAQYKTEFAFRGYIILEKDGEEVTLYGPPVARSIYFLAQQLLERGSYEPGTAIYDFLLKLINDADAMETP